ncbi:MAG: hypothetical protein QW794_00655 [Thermosphaera sp.]
MTYEEILERMNQLSEAFREEKTSSYREIASTYHVLKVHGGLIIAYTDAVFGDESFEYIVKKFETDDGRCIVFIHRQTNNTHWIYDLWAELGI